MLVDEHKNEAIQEYVAGTRLLDLGKKYNCNPETIKRRLVEWNVPVRSAGSYFRGKRKSEEHRRKLREHLNRIRPLAILAVKSGKRRSYKDDANPKWNGGSVRYFKQRVLARDGRKCRLCGYDEHPEIIEVDHINGNHFDNHLDNGWALCPNCHRIEEFKRNTFSTKLRPKRYA